MNTSVVGEAGVVAAGLLAALMTVVTVVWTAAGVEGVVVSVTKFDLGCWSNSELLTVAELLDGGATVEEEGGTQVSATDLAVC